MFTPEPQPGTLLPSGSVSATLGEPQPATAPTGCAMAPAISLAHVSKHFRLPHQQYHTLKERVLHPFRTRTYDVLQAVDDVTVEIAKGEFFGIVGRNGSGKSTMLKCLAGIYDTDAGRLEVNGRLSPFIELGVGFDLISTARDNAIINAIMLGLTRNQARERFDEIGRGSPNLRSSWTSSSRTTHPECTCGSPSPSPSRSTPTSFSSMRSLPSETHRFSRSALTSSCD